MSRSMAGSGSAYSAMTATHQDHQDHRDPTDRDRSTARILGVFLAVLSLPVLVGGFSAVDTIDLALGTAAGAALLLAAAVLMFYGFHGSRGRSEK